MWTDIDESLKIDINQYLKIIDLTILIEKLLTDAEIVRLVLKEHDKIKLYDKIN